MTTILVVDDSRTIQRTVALVLQREGYDVLTAPSGEAALKRLEKQAVDLLIVDLGMEGMDGITLVRTLRAEPRYAQLPIVVFTASGQQQDYSAVQDLAVNALLMKPASSHELSSTIREVLSQFAATQP